MTLLAAYQVLLARYSGQTDIAIGAPIANRRRGEIEGVIGFFANTLVLRNNLAHNPTFQNLLQQVRDTCMRAYTHQDIPFEKLVEVLQPERDLNRSPLFQATIAFQHIAPQTQQLSGLTLESVVQDNNSARFDLTLSLADMQDELFCGLEYNADLFETDTIQRMLGHYQTLLNSLVANPQMRIADLPLLSQPEQEQVLRSWNYTQADVVPVACLHHLFSAQVERTPDAIALVFEDQHLSYDQLDRLANQLAHVCQSLGVGPRALVGLCLHRSLELFIGILAILKAGGVYVPLDPAYPPDRLAYMLDDAQPTLLFTSAETASLVAESAIPQCCLPQCWSQLASQPAVAPPNAVTVEDGAYVIYTSGSTGKPKGVLVAHRGLGNLAYAQQQSFGVHANSHVLQFASLSFDASVSEMAVTLLAGATLYLAPQMQLMPGPDLLHILRERAITLVTLPPTALGVLPIDPLPQLETLVVAGEACPTDLAMRWGQGRRFINAYGPTEATVCASLEICEMTAQALSIGRPIANTQIYLLDTYLQPVPVGVPGEIYIGGIGLAQGYLHRPDLTAERFVPHPFVGTGQRLYKTGDLARWRADGRIDFLGRRDNQVKIRGYRIELDEIEAVLKQHPDIQSCVANVYEEHAGLKTIVAYIVARPEASVTSHDMREYLQSVLPEYMVPSFIIVLDRLPLTSNGKVDRRALLAPSAYQTAFSAEEPQALTPVQEVISGLFADLLELSSVPVEESFFALGGHSLLATQLLARLQQTLHVELPLRRLFEAASVLDLSACVEQALREQHGLARPDLLPASRQQPLPLSFAQQRLWFLDKFEPGSTTYLIPLAARLHGAFRPQAFRSSLLALMERHESLRTNFAVQAGQPLQVIVPVEQCHLGLPVVDLTHLPEAQRERVALELADQDARVPFELSRCPLLRVSLVRVAEDDHLLLMNMHHIISDGWSMTILVRELVTFYNSAVSGTETTLPELPVQYADFALWQRQWLQAEVLEQQLRYWKQQLGEMAPLELPTDYSRPVRMSFRGARQRATFPVPLLHGLKELC